jgi:hypothetical protein
MSVYSLFWRWKANLSMRGSDRAKQASIAMEERPLAGPSTPAKMAE